MKRNRVVGVDLHSDPRGVVTSSGGLVVQRTLRVSGLEQELSARWCRGSPAGDPDPAKVPDGARWNRGGQQLWRGMDSLTTVR